MKLISSVIMTSVFLAYLLPAAQKCAADARNAAAMKKAEFAYAANIQLPLSMQPQTLEEVSK